MLTIVVQIFKENVPVGNVGMFPHGSSSSRSDLGVGWVGVAALACLQKGGILLNMLLLGSLFLFSLLIFLCYEMYFRGVFCLCFCLFARVLNLG